MARMGKYFLLFLVLLLSSHAIMPLTVRAQAMNRQTLGPLEVRSAGNNGTYVRIVSLQNQSTLTNPIQLVFCVKATLLPFCYTQVGNIGYSLDNGVIYSVNNFINQTIVQGVADDATVWANVTLPSLSEGSHSVTVYFGWQFDEGLERYEVTAYTTANFTVTDSSSSSPTTTVPEFPITVSLVAVLAAVSLLLVIGKRKLTNH